MPRLSFNLFSKILVLIIIFIFIYFGFQTVQDNYKTHLVLIGQTNENVKSRKQNGNQRNGKVKNSRVYENHVKLNLKERYCHQFDLDGSLFDEHGKYEQLKHKVTSCLIHSFSPQIEYEASRRFLDPARGNIYYANSPAILWHNNEVILVSRIWLDREKYEDKKNWPANQFADNWLFMQKFDVNMRPVSNGTILGIPTPKQWWVGDGPIEPRLFKCKNKVLISFNAAMAFGPDNTMDYTVLWDVDRNLPIVPEILGGSPMINATEKDDMPRDKHWMALVIKDELFFVHNLDPLRILKCDFDGHCKFAYRESGPNGFIFSDAHSHLRGGTPFELYKYPYYISVAHTTMYKNKNNHRFYCAHLVVIRVNPFRVIYVSGPLQLNRKLFKMAPMIRRQYIDEGFMFPVGLIVEDYDSFDVGAHINDFNSIIIRIKGLKPLMEQIISRDEAKHPIHGPPPGYLNGHIHDMLEDLTSVELVHQVV